MVEDGNPSANCGWGIALAVGLASVAPLPSYGDASLRTPGVPSNSEARSFRKGIVTAANPLAAEAGAVVLDKGGNAIDAAAVVQFVLDVVEPTSSGIGGGGFVEIHLADENRTFLIDSRDFFSVTKPRHNRRPLGSLLIDTTRQSPLTVSVVCH